jgi:hypothetical protein
LRRPGGASAAPEGPESPLEILPRQHFDVGGDIALLAIDQAGQHAGIQPAKQGAQADDGAMDRAHERAALVRQLAEPCQDRSQLPGIGGMQRDHLPKQRRHAPAFSVVQRLLIAMARVDGMGVQGLQVVENVGAHMSSPAGADMTKHV